MELLPSFDDIQLEPEEARIDHDAEVIPRPAPMHQRLVAGLVDVGIVFIATGAFAFTFVEAGGGDPALQHDDGMHAGCRWNLLAGFSIYFSRLSASHSRNEFRRA